MVQSLHRGVLRHGPCELRIDGLEPKDFKDWSAALDFLDGCRVVMQEDTCARWEECR